MSVPWSHSRIGVAARILVGLGVGSWSAPSHAQGTAACTAEVEPNERAETAQVVAALCASRVTSPD